MKIMLVHNQYQQTGGEEVVFRQERQLLQDAGHTVVAFNRSNDEIREYDWKDRIRLVNRTVWSEHTRREFAGALAQEKPDIVHVHNVFVVISPSVYSACCEAGIPIVQTLHNYRLFCPAGRLLRDGKVCEECVDHNLWRSVRYGCYRDSRTASATVALALAVHRRRKTWAEMIDVYIALTHFARNKFIEFGLPPDRVVVKPNFVGPDPGPRSKPGDYALFVGRLSPEKGVHTLLNAWQSVPRSIPLVILGDGPLRSALENQARSASLSNVSFKGQASRDNTLAAMKGCRFLLFPSEWYESFPMTVLEAYACAVPVLASGIGALQEVVQNGHTGLWFRPGDASDIAAKVCWAWGQPEYTRKLGEQARRVYEVRYTGRTNYRELMQIYEHALKRYRPASSTAEQPVS